MKNLSPKICLAIAALLGAANVGLANAIEGEVDIDSWSILTGQVTRDTCLYSEPSTGSYCKKKLNTYSVLTAWRTETIGEFVKTEVIESNPNFRCSYDPFRCTGQPYLREEGYVVSNLFEISRVRSSCDGVDNLYLRKPTISCSGRSCEVEVSFSTYPQVEMRVEVEIDTFDEKGNRIGREDENETSYSGTSVDVDFRFRDDDVVKVVVSDVDCEKW